MMTLIPALPEPPRSTRPEDFALRADDFLGELPGFAAAANAQAEENNALHAAIVDVEAAVAAAALTARNAADLALAAVAAPSWSADMTYTAGALAWSPITGLVYRRSSAGKSSVDPSADPGNWLLPGGAPEPEPEPTGVVEVSDATVQAASGVHYVLTATGSVDVQLPSEPALGDIVTITVANGLKTNVASPADNTIMGLAESLLIDVISAVLRLQWLPAGSGYTWRIV